MKMKPISAILMALFVLVASKSQADQVRYLPHAESALASFLNLIASADKSISLQTFIFEPCDVSTQVIMQALESRAKRGVRVRILLDDFMQSRAHKKQLATYFRDRGIELRWYNTGLLNLNFRSHIKLIVADGERYISGGRNIADDYFGLKEGANFVDRDLYVVGRSALKAQKEFELAWNSKWVSEASQKTESFKRWSEVCENKDDNKVQAVTTHIRAHAKALLSRLPVRECRNVRFIADEPGAKLLGGHNETISEARAEGKHATAEFMDFVTRTKKSLILENWSMMPNTEISLAVFNLRWYRTPVLVLTNDNMDGPGILKEAEDSFNNRAARLRNKGSVVVKQISMNGSLSDRWKLTPKNAKFRLHGKVGTRDDQDILVSSFNIDSRSYALNLESMIRIEDCPELAFDLNRGYTELLEVKRKDIADGVPPNNNETFAGFLLGLLGHSFF